MSTTGASHEIYNVSICAYWNSSLKSSGGTDPKENDANEVFM